MLIPKFTLGQDDKEVRVRIRLPFVRVGDAEIHVDGRDLSFYCKPYLLKLHFPHELCHSEDEASYRAVYDADLDNGTLTLHLRKKKKGLFFEDLDMTTRLLQPIKSFDAKERGGPVDPPSIEVLASESFVKEGEGGSSSRVDEKEGAGEGGVVASPSEGPSSPGDTTLRVIKPRYGFNRQYSGVFGGLREDMVDVLHVPDPDMIAEGMYEKMRIERERSDFDAERYLGDMLEGDDDPVYLEAMRMEAFWEQQARPLPPAAATGDEKDGGAGLELSESEAEEMRSLKNREFLVDDKDAVLLGMVDILLAFAYDHRTTGAEPTVESAWTITTLSPSLCWLQSYHSATHSCRDVTIAFLRRCLTYPYLRRWDLAKRVLRDGALILGQRRHILRCLLKTRAILRRTESHYLLNRLFLDDLCVYVQHLSDADVAALSQRYRAAAAAVGKADVGLDLERVEALAREEGSAPSPGDGDAETEEESGDEDEHDDDSDSESTACTEASSSLDDDGDEEEEEEEGAVGTSSVGGAAEALCGGMAGLRVGGAASTSKEAGPASDKAADSQQQDPDRPPSAAAREVLTGEGLGSLLGGLVIGGRPSQSSALGETSQPPTARAQAAPPRPLIQELS